MRGNYDICDLYTTCNPEDQHVHGMSEYVSQVREVGDKFCM